MRVHTLEGEGKQQFGVTTSDVSCVLWQGWGDYKIACDNISNDTQSFKTTSSMTISHNA